MPSAPVVARDLPYLEPFDLLNRAELPPLGLADGPVRRLFGRFLDGVQRLWLRLLGAPLTRRVRHHAERAALPHYLLDDGEENAARGGAHGHQLHQKRTATAWLRLWLIGAAMTSCVASVE